MLNSREYKAEIQLNLKYVEACGCSHPTCAWFLTVHLANTLKSMEFISPIKGCLRFECGPCFDSSVEQGYMKLKPETANIQSFIISDSGFPFSHRSVQLNHAKASHWLQPANPPITNQTSSFLIREFAFHTLTLVRETLCSLSWSRRFRQIAAFIVLEEKEEGDLRPQLEKDSLGKKNMWIDWLAH